MSAACGHLEQHVAMPYASAEAFAAAMLGEAHGRFPEYRAVLVTWPEQAKARANVTLPEGHVLACVRYERA